MDCIRLRLVTRASRESLIALPSETYMKKKPLTAGAVACLLIACSSAPGPAASDIVRIEADPSRGFNYAYYLWIPRPSERGDIDRLLVSPTNSSRPDDDMGYHDGRTYAEISRGWKSRVAGRLGVPHLMPVFPRPASEWTVYTHSLDRDAMLIGSGTMARLDLQLLAMIADARDLLAERGITVRERVFMNGFSACGTFANRFAMLHPGSVKAVASGGVNAVPTIPSAELDGVALPYPVGLADVEEITGSPFDRDAYLRVAQYIYMGADDDNDTTLYRDGYGEAEAELVWRVLGKGMGVRWDNAVAAYARLGVPAQMHTYAGVGHALTPAMLDDIAAFFRANHAEGIRRIEPTGP